MTTTSYLSRRLRAPLWRIWLRLLLRRVWQLKQASPDPSHGDAYFRNFEDSLLTNRQKLAAFRRLEAQLLVLDSGAWRSLMHRAVPHLISRQKNAGRGWQQLFDTLNEAKAYGYLRRLGCRHVAFVPAGKTATPDLRGTLRHGSVLCEVKTQNISKDEATRQTVIKREGLSTANVQTSLDQAYLTGKFEPTLGQAQKQLTAVDPRRSAIHIIFLTIHFDDWVGDYAPQYLAQIDEYLSARTSETEIVVSFRDLFVRNLNMEHATVLCERECPTRTLIVAQLLSYFGLRWNLTPSVGSAR